MSEFSPAVEKIVTELQQKKDPNNIAGMARYGIRPKKPLGIPVPLIRSLAKQIGKHHRLALELWETEIHEARLLACLIAEPSKLTEQQAEKWVKDFDSWGICDGCCNNLFDKSPFAYRKVIEWSDRQEEYVKRAAFSLMASLSVHDKQAEDQVFESWLPIIKKASADERNFVKKAVNWALRAVGKRNHKLNKLAINQAEQIGKMDSPSARWIAADALRELRSEKVVRRLKHK